ncbi:hypothetical protein [Saccharomonospora halophila]|uniref:hypothetical protein n=1 Tax=Saccharomonospora halophila TaxID=129922 RepID=UPI00039EC6DD|nr:hypothetical protein [Saccharomonospora halophila]
MVTRRRPGARVVVAWSLVAGFAVVATLVSVKERDPGSPPRPVSVAEAEALLTEAVRRVRADDYGGLCRDVADGAGICEMLLRDAWRKNLVPDDSMPGIISVTRPADGTVRLHLRGTYADGTSYRTHFSVHRTRDTGMPRSGAPVYWLPMGTGSADGTCVHDDGHVRCGGPATAPAVRPPR